MHRVEKRQARIAEMRAALTGTAQVTRGLLPPARAMKSIEASHHRIEVSHHDIARFGIEDHRAQFNPSVTVHDGELWISIRVSTPAHTQNVLGVVLDSWELFKPRPMLDLVADVNGPRPASGYEDARLFSRAGRLWASATIWPPATLCVLELDAEGNVRECHPQRSRVHEKNWMPLVTGEELRFIYAIDPVPFVLKYQDKFKHVTPLPEKLVMQPSNVRGGSQVIPYEDGFLCVVHQVHESEDKQRAKFVYAQRLAKLDRFLGLERVSAPFMFQRRGIEFCAGLCEWHGDFVLSYGLEDSSAQLAVVKREVVRAMLAQE